MIKTRCFPESNYKSIYFADKTIRFATDPDKPILDLEYPEFMDIKITNNCRGKCPYCYQNSVEEDNYENICIKIKEFFSKMTANQRPYQVALGGGEPTEHPEFTEVLRTLHDLGITPNYTTNGMNITPAILRAAKQYCGGVAVSTHPHLRQYWEVAIDLYTSMRIKTNLHCIISDSKSVDNFLKIFEKYNKVIEHFVVLPYMAQGRAPEKELAYDYFFDAIELFRDRTSDFSKIAYGARFYDELVKRKMEISIYEPEIMSKYLDLKDMKVYPSSFSLGESKHTKYTQTDKLQGEKK